MEKTMGTDRSIKLTLCDCGGLRLSSGPVTIHFTQDEFQLFAEAVGRLASIVALPTLGRTSKTTRPKITEACH